MTYGTSVWNELVSPDSQKSGAFYTVLVGWMLRHAAMGEAGSCTLFQNDRKDVGGLMQTLPGAPGQAHRNACLAVDDLRAVLAEVAELGGTVRRATRCYVAESGATATSAIGGNAVRGLRIRGSAAIGSAT